MNRNILKLVIAGLLFSGTCVMASEDFGTPNLEETQEVASLSASTQEKLKDSLGVISDSLQKMADELKVLQLDGTNIGVLKRMFEELSNYIESLASLRQSMNDDLYGKSYSNPLLLFELRTKFPDFRDKQELRSFCASSISCEAANIQHVSESLLNRLNPDTLQIIANRLSNLSTGVSDLVRRELDLQDSTHKS